MLVMGVPKGWLRQYNSCPHACVRKDCDGDEHKYCLFDGSCNCKVVKKDCDGDKVAFCGK